MMRLMLIAVVLSIFLSSFSIINGAVIFNRKLQKLHDRKKSVPRNFHLRAPLHVNPSNTRGAVYANILPENTVDYDFIFDEIKNQVGQQDIETSLKNVIVQMSPGIQAILHKVFFIYWTQQSDRLLYGSGTVDSMGFCDLIYEITKNAAVNCDQRAMNWVLEMVSVHQFTGFSKAVISALSDSHKDIPPVCEKFFSFNFAQLRSRLQGNDILYSLVMEAGSAFDDSNTGYKIRQPTGFQQADIWLFLRRMASHMMQRGIGRQRIYNRLLKLRLPLSQRFNLAEIPIEDFQLALDIIQDSLEMNIASKSHLANVRFEENFNKAVGFCSTVLFLLPDDRQEAARRLEFLVPDLEAMNHPHEKQKALSALAKSGALRQILHLTPSKITDPPFQHNWMTAASFHYLKISVEKGFSEIVNDKVCIDANLDHKKRLATILHGLAYLKKKPGWEKRTAIVHLLHLLSPSEKTFFKRYVSLVPHFSWIISSELMSLSFMNLGMHGDAIDNFADVFESLVPELFDHLSSLRDYEKSQEKADLRTDLSELPYAPLDDAKVVNVHGRTLYVECNGRIKAIKFPKAGNVAELEKEMFAIDSFETIAPILHLKSQLPKKARLIRTSVNSNLYLKLKNFANRGEYEIWFAPKQKVVALEFDPPFRYQYHLHEMETLEDLHQSSATILHDIGRLAKNRIVSLSPADLFHNQYEDRRFVALKNLVERHHRYGTGRCPAFLKAIEHANFGYGLRDLKQFQHVDSLAETVIPLGNFLFSWSLSVARWYLEKFPEENYGQSMWETLLIGFSAFYAGYKGVSGVDAERFLLAALNLRPTAAQLMYFTTGRYIPFMSKGVLPKGTYDSNTVVYLGAFPDKFWSDSLGWTHDGENADLGALNGVFPVQSLIKSIYFLLMITLD